MADAFDRARYGTRLRTHRLGHALCVLERAASTNDEAWEALARLGDGAAILALEQTGGRGRAGRAWTHVPGRGLALSVVLRLDRDTRHAGLVPLAAGLAAVRAAHALGVERARLKWPNDVTVEGRKLAGVLCEARGIRAGEAADAAASAGADDAVVIGVGINVRHRRDEFPEGLRDTATSLALEGSSAGIEDAAAEFLTRLEPLWNGLRAGDRAALLADWSRECGHWGRRLLVRSPAGPVEGIAQRLDPDGGLVLLTSAGEEIRVLAGDVIPSTAGCDTV